MNPYNLLSLAILFDDNENFGGGEPVIRRFLAFAIDVYTIFLLFWLIGHIPIGIILSNWEWEIFIILASPLLILLFTTLESSNYRASPGKLFVGLVTVNNDGKKLSFKKSLVRNMIKWLPFFLPIICDLIFKLDTSNISGFWFALTCLTVFLGWFTLHDFFAGSTINCRPSFYKLHHDSHDVIIG